MIRFAVAVAVTTFFALILAAMVAQAQDQKQLDYQMLNQWRKEIVRLQYTDFCATVKAPSPAMQSILKQVIEQGKEQKHPVADEIESWFGSIMEQYKEKGCGDA